MRSKQSISPCRVGEESWTRWLEPVPRSLPSIVGGGMGEVALVDVDVDVLDSSGTGAGGWW